MEIQSIIFTSIAFTVITLISASIDLYWWNRYRIYPGNIFAKGNATLAIAKLVTVVVLWVCCWMMGTI